MTQQEFYKDCSTESLIRMRYELMHWTTSLGPRYKFCVPRWAAWSKLIKQELLTRGITHS